MTSLGPHTRPACNQATVDNLLNPKRWFWPQYSFFLLTSGDARGLGLLLRMCSRSTRKCAHMNAGDLGSILAVCAGQRHWAELRMRPTTTQLGVFLWIRMFFTACQTSARWLVERGHVNKLMTYRMLMSHVTLKHNTPIAFLALWLVTTWSSPVYYS